MKSDGRNPRSERCVFRVREFYSSETLNDGTWDGDEFDPFFGKKRYLIAAKRKQHHLDVFSTFNPPIVFTCKNVTRYPNHLVTDYRSSYKGRPTINRPRRTLGSKVHDADSNTTAPVDSLTTIVSNRAIVISSNPFS